MGKSTLLTQTVAYARNKGYVIIYIPRARDWTHGGGFFAAANEAGETDSAVGFEGKGVRWWDRPMEMKELFENLLAAHAEDLKEVEISVKECVESDMTEGCENVTQLLEKGVRLMDDIDSNWRLYPLQAGEILSLVIENLLASDVRTGVVIDDYHMLTGMTNMRNSKQRRLHANGIRFVAQHLGRDAIEETARKNENGFVIVATENEPPFEEWRSSRVLGGSQWPLSDESRSDASGRIWWDSFRRRVETLQVPELKGGELKAICSTFSRGGLRERERDDGRGSVDRLVALAGGRADVMRKVFEVR